MVGSLQIVDYVSLGLHGIEKALDERIYLAPRLDRLDPAFRDCVEAVVRAGDLSEDSANGVRVTAEVDGRDQPFFEALGRVERPERGLQRGNRPAGVVDEFALQLLAGA